MSEINLRKYIDPLGRWPRFFLDDKGVAWIEYVITEKIDVFKFVKAPQELLDKIEIKRDSITELSK